MNILYNITAALAPSLHTQELNEAKRINPRCCCTCCASRWIGLPRRKIVCADLVIVVGVVTRLVRGRGVTPLVRGRGHHDLLIFAGRARKYLFSCTQQYIVAERKYCTIVTGSVMLFVARKEYLGLQTAVLWRAMRIEKLKVMKIRKILRTSIQSSLD